MRPIARQADGRSLVERARCDSGPCRPTTFLKRSSTKLLSDGLSQGRYRPPVKFGTVNLIALLGAN